MRGTAARTHHTTNMLYALRAITKRAAVPTEITNLLDVNRADRKLRAYAYLTASFQGRSNVQDALDCLMPFVAAALTEQKARPISFNDIARFVARLGLKIPVYVLEQLLSRLKAEGLVKWDGSTRKHIVISDPEGELSSQVSDKQIGDAFDAIEQRLGAYGASHNMQRPPFSQSWPEALIAFLKSEQSSEIIKSVDFRGALIGDAQQLESYLIALFIQDCDKRDKGLFESVVTIFTGIIIEDFIENIQTISAPNGFSRLSIYYDTTVLLRLLGTSGKLLQSATLEMHRTLQDLGCKTYYFDFVELETSNVLGAVLAAHRVGQNIYNETAEAIYSGEIAISDIKDIAATLTVQLGALNVFPFIYNFNARKSEDAFQIDEKQFADSLMSDALSRDRTYKQQNAETDARSAAIVFRLRRGQSRRDVSAAGHLFISRNSLLQRVSRKFSMRHVEDYNEVSTPPILTVGQITTIAWLTSTRKLEPHKVSKELLAACYSAVRPSPGWADEFSKALSKFQQENPALVEDRANQHFFLQTARAMAKDESLGQAAVLRKLSLTDMFADAAREAEQQENATRQRIEQLEARIKELEALQAGGFREDLGNP